MHGDYGYSIAVPFLLGISAFMLTSLGVMALAESLQAFCDYLLWLLGFAYLLAVHRLAWVNTMFRYQALGRIMFLERALEERASPEAMERVKGIEPSS